MRVYAGGRPPSSLATVPVDADQLFAVRDMARREPSVRAALAQRASALDAEALTVAGATTDAPEAFRDFVLPEWARFLREAQRQRMVQGCVVFSVATIHVDASRDAFFVRDFGEARRALVERGELAADKMLSVEFSIPVAAADDTYTLCVFQDELRRCRVWATDADVAAAGEGDASASASAASSSSLAIAALQRPFGAGAEPERRRRRPLYVLHGPDEELPSLRDGGLCSRLASLLDGYMHLKAVRDFAVRAAFAKSRPPVVLRVVPDDKQPSEVYLEAFADETITGVASRNKRKVVSGLAQEVARKKAEFMRAELESGRRAAEARARDPLQRLRDRREKLMTPVADSMFLLAERTELGAQPSMPAEPENLPFLEDAFVAAAARVLEVPQGALAPVSKAGGGGAAAGSTATAEDARNFARSVNAEHALLMSGLAAAFATVHGPAAPRVAFSAPRNLGVALEDIYTLFEAGFLNEDDAGEEARRTVALSHLRPSARRPQRQIVKQSLFGAPLRRPDGSSALPQRTTFTRRGGGGS